MVEFKESRGGVVIRSRNGDVIGYDATGLTMRLSDKVISDIAARMNMSTTTAPKSGAGAIVSSESTTIITENLLEGIDAWDVRQDGDWLSFMARRPGKQGLRRFCRHVTGGAIVAEGPGPFYGLFTLGGPRAALAAQGSNEFPHNIFSADDDIGAVGQGGEQDVVETPLLMSLREQTHEALTAETLLSWQLEQHNVLPLFMVRCETDSSPSATALTDGAALKNLLADIANFGRAAALLGKRPKIMAIGLDFVLEDVVSDSEAYRDAMLAIMSRIEEGVGALGFDQPLFVMRLETSDPAIDNEAAVTGQWEVAWNHGDHNVRISAPGFMFPTDTTGRYSDDTRREMAEMTAAALAAGEEWSCPLPCLAERCAEGIRVVVRAAGSLVIDANDPLGAGIAAGFSLEGDSNGAEIASVMIDPEDSQAVILGFNRTPEGSNLVLLHGCGPQPSSRLRDEWQLKSNTGRTLHRWTLPACLPVRKGNI